MVADVIPQFEQNSHFSSKYQGVRKSKVIFPINVVNLAMLANSLEYQNNKMPLPSVRDIEML